jgi:hypothetical protein
MEKCSTLVCTCRFEFTPKTQAVLTKQKIEGKVVRDFKHSFKLPKIFEYIFRKE